MVLGVLRLWILNFDGRGRESRRGVPGNNREGGGALLRRTVMDGWMDVWLVVRHDVVGWGGGGRSYLGLVDDSD